MSKTFYIVSAVVIIVLLGGLLFTFMRATPVASNPSPAPEPVATAPTPNPTPAPAAPPTTPPSAANQTTITYSDSGFSPSALTIKKGTTVIFKNMASNAFWPASNVHPSHAAYDGTNLMQHCAAPTSNTFDACKSLPPGSSWSFVPTRPGTWNYHDHLNPGEGGTITVQ